jgi:hypothetical protein
MEKKSDMLLHKLLKNWANRHTPPANGRARLLWAAAHASQSKKDSPALISRSQFRSDPSSYSDDWTQTFFTWINENSFQFGLQARLS